MITITRKLWFSAGHRVLGHEGACANLHGHNYQVYLSATASKLDSVGRVVDFSVLKDRFGTWIDLHWDHGFIYFKQDEAVCRAFMREELIGMKRWIAPFNPTAENLAQHLLALGAELLHDTNVQLTRVVVFETPNCWAEATWQG